MNQEQMLEHRNVYNRYARHMGVKTLEIRDGYARSEMEIIPDYTNAIGSVHGACIFSIADCCTGSFTYFNLHKPILAENKEDC